MTNIIAFAGKKQSGKSTCANFLHGYQMRSQGIISDFGLSKEGKLLVQTEEMKSEKEVDQKLALIDVNRKDYEFAEWAAYSMWPFIKNYSFAEPLKQLALNLFNIPEECMYGTDEQKNQLQEHLRWENMPGVCTNEKFFKFMQSKMEHDLAEDEEDAGYKLIYHAAGPMTAREFLQFLGTDVMRKMYEPIWVKYCIDNIQSEESLIATIDDVRFLNELEAVQKVGGKVIYLDRNNDSKDGHSSENELCNNLDKFDAVIDNSDLSILDTSMEVMKLIEEWGWLEENVSITANKESK
jgi:hypothetical protein